MDNLKFRIWDKINNSYLRELSPYKWHCPYGLDEEEEEWYGRVYNLRDFIGYLRVTRQIK